jgi:hypothetical protein
MNIKDQAGENNPLLAAALAYAEMGYPVVACYGIVGGSICTCGGRPKCKPGKHPIPTNGHLDATTDAEVIRRWWSDHPWANVGIVMGKASGAFVVESDPRNGGDETMAALIAEHGPPPKTPTVQSGGGGSHRYYRLPQGVTVKSRPIAKGVDAKGSGLVIAPPSMHASGRRYESVTPLSTPLADAPSWLWNLLETTEVTPDARCLAASVGGDDDGAFTMASSEPNDFASHPGASMGMRNDTMCRLLGVHLSRGDSPATVETLALAWAERCSPPIPEADVYARLRWAEGKRMGAEDEDRCVGGGDGDNASGADERTNPVAGEAGNGLFVSSQPVPVNSTPSLPPHHLSTVDGVENMNGKDALADPDAGGSPDDWPTLGAEAYHGILGEIVNAIAPETEADSAGILITFLAAFGNAVGRSPHFMVGPKPHSANLYVAIVGDTASGKGVSWGVVDYLMQRADPEWASQCIGYGLSSGEGLIERVKDEDDPADCFTMPTTKRLLCLETEFARPITVMRREGNTLSEVIRSA